MAKPKKDEKKIARPGKHDITVKLDMTFEEAMKKAVNTPPKKNPKKSDKK
jgi:hypothetical protein